VTESFKPIPCNFEEIKRHLDPAYGYMIFEKPSESGEKPEFQQIFDILLRLDLSIHEWKCFRDEARGISLLVVRFDPGRTNRIVHEFLNLGLPEGITFYAYDSPVT
jgi:hypothetical protein